MIRGFPVKLATAAFLAFAPGSAVAQDDYPTRPVRIVVPLAAGGIADIVPRIVADKLALKWRQPVVIENRPGAGHNIGAEAVAKAPPDGYTLLATPQAPLVVSQHLSSKLPFDPDAFVPISTLTTGNIVLIVNANVPASNLRELVAYAKANPGKLRYASPGTGSSPHLTGEMLSAAAGIRMIHVPYKGLAPAVNDLLAGHVDLMFDNLGNSLQHIRSGKLRALGVASDKRIPQLPDVPAVSESYLGFVATSWFAVVAPPRTPSQITRKISADIAEALRLPDVEKRLRGFTIEPVGNSPEATAELISHESARWRNVITSTGLKAK
ncbi:MAG: tripartite tricarboxylate transporter substrate binding protein [Rhizobiales bacterium]|nr:tripartite tricarboxylate transporter substrate binding protein [Hyphomicrobiales bacterium]